MAEEVADAHLLAHDEEEWESIHCRRNVFPIGLWGVELGDGTLLVKDTVGKGPYPNRLVNNNTFEYYLPANKPLNPNSNQSNMCDERDERTRTMKEAFFNELLVKDVRDKRRVRIFAMTESADHYLGEWVVHTIKVARSPVVTLRRLATQRTAVNDQYAIRTSERSRSEARHAPVVRAFFEEVLGGPVLVFHEPSTVCDLQAPYVQKGRCTLFSADAYTIDFVASDAAGLVSFGIESKSCVEEAMLPKAVAKCEYYRDKNVRRTLTFAGHEDALRILDFGPPRRGGGGGGGAAGAPHPTTPTHPTHPTHPFRVYSLQEAREVFRR